MPAANTIRVSLFDFSLLYSSLGCEMKYVGLAEWCDFIRGNIAAECNIEMLGNRISRSLSLLQFRQHPSR